MFFRLHAIVAAIAIEDLARFLKVPPAKTIKTLLVDGRQDDVVALVVRGDHELNAIKARSYRE